LKIGPLDSSGSQALDIATPRCVRCWVVWSLLITVTYCIRLLYKLTVRNLYYTQVHACMCVLYLKGFCVGYVYFRWAARTVGLFTVTCVYRQPSWAERRSSTAHLLAKCEHERTTAWRSRAQRGGQSSVPTDGIHYKPRRFSSRVECNRRILSAACPRI